ncbi:hypothetical protein [Streptomyces sp. NPDC005970]
MAVEVADDLTAHLRAAGATPYGRTDLVGELRSTSYAAEPGLTMIA